MARPGDDPLAELARRAAGGDRGALRDLLREVGPPMTAVVRRMVPSADVEDAAQEALMAFIKALTAFRFESGVRHFACRVAVRSTTVFNRGRTRKLRADDLGRTAHELGAPTSTPLGSALAAQRRALLLEHSSELPPEQAEALNLRVVLGCTLEEVAEATGAPVNTVRSRLRLAKDALKKRLEADPRAAALIEPTEDAP
ncbi:MAG: RNA polymerase sigma factor [Sandaracinaceae bacterium]